MPKIGEYTENSTFDAGSALVQERSLVNSKILPATLLNLANATDLGRYITAQILNARLALDVFGNDFVPVQRTTTLSNGTTTPADYLTTGNVVLPAGTYSADWMYVWSHDNTTRDFTASIQIDIDGGGFAPFYPTDHREEPADGSAAQRLYTSGRVQFTVATDVEIKITFNPINGADTSTMYFASIALVRVL